MDQKEIQVLEKEEKGLVAEVEKMEIASVEDLKSAVTMNQKIRDLIKRFKNFLDFLTKDLKADVKKKEDWVKPYIKNLEAKEKSLKTRMDMFEEKREAARLKEEEKLRKQQEKEYQKKVEKAKKNDTVVQPPPAPVKIEPEKVEGYSARKIWDVEEVDIKKVPYVFNGVPLLVSDIKAARKLVKAGVREIPGFRIYQKRSSAILSGKEESTDIGGL